jgi:CopG family transcriptional regulator/antitoxin EndoAI
MNRRINIVLPEVTVRKLDRVAKPGERSRFIDKAVRHYIAYESAASLRARMEHAAARDRDLDREIAQDWSAVDQDAWTKLDDPQGAATSSSRRSTRR